MVRISAEAGIFIQPVAFVMLLTAGMAESKRVPVHLPEGESELVAGYFTEYSGGKQAAFMLTDFAEVVLAAVLLTLFFFGGHRADGGATLRASPIRGNWQGRKTACSPPIRQCLSPPVAAVVAKRIHAALAGNHPTIGRAARPGRAAILD